MAALSKLTRRPVRIVSGPVIASMAIPSGEPQKLTEKYRPLNLDAFVGLDGPKRIFSKFAAAPYSSAWYLLGDSGTGKTTIARVLCDLIGGELYHVPSRLCDLDRVLKLLARCAYRPMRGRFHFILIDEADKMTTAAQLAFLSVLDGSNPLEDVIFVFTSNDVSKVESRFLSRCNLLKFESKSMDVPAAAFLRTVWTEEGGVGTPDFARIFQQSDRNVRTALNNLEMLLMDPSFEMVEAPKPFIMPKRASKPSTCARPVDPKRRDAALKAWETMRLRKVSK